MLTIRLVHCKVLYGRYMNGGAYFVLWHVCLASVRVSTYNNIPCSWLVWHCQCWFTSLLAVQIDFSMPVKFPERRFGRACFLSFGSEAFLKTTKSSSSAFVTREHQIPISFIQWPHLPMDYASAALGRHMNGGVHFVLWHVYLAQVRASSYNNLPCSWLVWHHQCWHAIHKATGLIHLPSRGSNLFQCDSAISWTKVTSWRYQPLERPTLLGSREPPIKGYIYWCIFYLWLFTCCYWFCGHFLLYIIFRLPHNPTGTLEDGNMVVQAVIL